MLQQGHPPLQAEGYEVASAQYSLDTNGCWPTSMTAPRLRCRPGGWPGDLPRDGGARQTPAREPQPVLLLQRVRLQLTPSRRAHAQAIERGGASAASVEPKSVLVVGNTRHDLWAA